MAIKLIVMDMDGTLLKSDNTISEKTHNALMKAQQEGVKIALASGRSFGKLLNYADDLEMAKYGGYLIEVNGMALYDLKKQERHVYKRLNHQDVSDLFDFLKSREVETQYVLDQGMFIYMPQRVIEIKKAYRKEHNISDDFPWTGGPFGLLADNRKGYPYQKFIESADDVDQDINKVTVADGEQEVVKKIAEEMAQHFGERFWLGRTAPSWLEIMPQGITKGAGLKRLCDLLNISLDEVMCFGDGENDLDMIEAVTYGIAMGNAMDNVKEAAYATTEDNNSDGIANALVRYHVINE